MPRERLSNWKSLLIPVKISHAYGKERNQLKTGRIVIDRIARLYKEIIAFLDVLYGTANELTGKNGLKEVKNS